MSEHYDYDLVCIGSGPAGLRAAIQAAKLGRRVAVIEKKRIVGGVCLDTGTIPSKTLREAVLALTARRRSEGRSTTGQRPTAAELLARVGEVVQREAEVLEDQLQRNAVEIVRGAARFTDPHTLAVEDGQGWRTISAAHVLIAVGTTPACATGVPVDGRVLLSSDDVLRLERLPRTLAVVGAGVIGIEYAAMFAELGVEVTVIDRRDRPLEFLDHELVDELIHQMRNRRATFRLSESVSATEVVTGNRPQAVITLESGKTVVTEAALFSVGRVGATDSLNLEAAGLSTDDRGRLMVDQNFCTAVRHIYAAGDVVGFPSLAATAMEQGRIAACHAFGKDSGPMADHFPIGIYAIPEISMVGRTEQELTAEKVPYELGLARYRDIARGQILGDDSGFVKLLFHRQEQSLLGVHAIGTGATELIHIGQAVLGLGGGLQYFLDTVFNYPTLAECYKVAALDAHNKLSRLPAGVEVEVELDQPQPA